MLRSFRNGAIGFIGWLDARYAMHVAPSSASLHGFHIVFEFYILFALGSLENIVWYSEKLDANFRT